MSLDSDVRAKLFLFFLLLWRWRSVCISADPLTLKCAAFDLDKD